MWSQEIGVWALVIRKEEVQVEKMEEHKTVNFMRLLSGNKKEYKCACAFSVCVWDDI